MIFFTNNVYEYKWKLSIQLVFNRCVKWQKKIPTYKRLDEATKKVVIILKRIKAKNCNIAKRLKVNLSSAGILKEHHQTGQLRGCASNSKDSTHLKYVTVFWFYWTGNKIVQTAETLILLKICCQVLGTKSDEKSQNV